jgi:hypothetical protein
MSAEQVESTIAFTVGFAIAGCWSLISGTVVVLVLAAFGVPAGWGRPTCSAVRREIGGDDASRHLAQADRFIAECKDRIARQREIITSAYENGLPTVLPVSLLRALEENVRSFEKHHQLILDQIKKVQAQQQ